MKCETKSVSTQPEILKRKLDGALVVPVTIASGAFTNGLVKAGTPINADGAVATTSEGANDAVGILLNDVTDDNPNGALIKAFAVVNATVGATYSGVTYDATLKATLSNIVFE